MKDFVFKIIVLGSLSSASLALAESNDVYNFYFQKAPGPTQVIQGGPQTSAPTSEPSDQASAVAPAVTEASQSEASTTSAATPQKETTEQEFNPKWELMLGTGRVVSERGYFKGLGAQVDYNLNKYFGFSLSFINANTRERDYVGNVTGDKPSIDWSLGTTFTPVHIETFGYNLIDFGFVAGLMSNERMNRDNAFPREKVTVDFYFGPRLAINFSQAVGLVAEWRTSRADTRYGQSTAFIRYRF